MEEPQKNPQKTSQENSQKKNLPLKERPILVVMAAGMGSRYGGLKQMDPIGPSGEVIVDYSVWDAWRAGFHKIVFIIKKEIAHDFREKVGKNIERVMDVHYAYQEITNLPAGYSVPEGRVKPWGTAHAILSAADQIDAPFAVINADDYYGLDAFQLIYDYLVENSYEKTLPYNCAMVGFQLGNTVTENGHVARGVTSVDENGHLTSIVEHTRIETYPSGIHSSFDNGKTWTDLPFETTVSMNLWGFPQRVVGEIKDGFPTFLDRALAENPLKAEYFLPDVVSSLLEQGKANVQVLTSTEKWYGVTYQEDKPAVIAAINHLVDEEIYPPRLWPRV